MALVAIYMPTTLTFIIKFSCVYRGPEPYILRYPVSEGSMYKSKCPLSQCGPPFGLSWPVGRAWTPPRDCGPFSAAPSLLCVLNPSPCPADVTSEMSHIFLLLHLHCLRLTQPQVSHSDTHSSFQVVYTHALCAASHLFSSHSRHSDTFPKIKLIILCCLLFATIQ